MAYVADPAPDTDLTDPDDTRALVRAFVLPGILALRESTGEPSPQPSTNQPVHRVHHVHHVHHVHTSTTFTHTNQGGSAMTTVDDDQRC